MAPRPEQRVSDDPEKKREQIRHFLHYEYWSDFFGDLDGEYREYPADGITILGMVGEEKFTVPNGGKVYSVRPVRLCPLETLSSLFDMEVSMMSLTEREKGTLIFCRIRYTEEEKQYWIKKYYRVVSSEIYPCDWFGFQKKAEDLIPGIIESSRKHLDELRAVFQEIDLEEKGLLPLIDLLKGGRELSLTELKEELIRDENAVVRDLEAIRQERKRLDKEKDLTERVKEKIRTNEDFISEYINENREIRDRYRSNKKKHEELVKEDFGLTDENDRLTAEIRSLRQSIGEKDYELLAVKASEQYGTVKKKELESLLLKRQEQLDREYSLSAIRIDKGHRGRMSELEEREKAFEEKHKEKERELKEKEKELSALEEEIKREQQLREEKERELEREKDRFERMLEEHKRYIEEEKQGYIGILRPFIDRLERAENEETEAVRSFVKENGIEEEIHEKLIDHIVGSLWNRLRYYKNSRETVSSFVSAIGSGQIILLTGAPGSGKTSFPEQVGKAVGAEVRRIVVQPNWTDSQDLLGYYNANDRSFVHTPFSDALTEAAEALKEAGRTGADAPEYFIVLDEMNLAHVEYYFSLILSAMEVDGRLCLVSRTELEELDPEEAECLKDLRIPENVQFIGTLNTDELSKNVSPKVLDRSIVIELIPEEDEEKIRETLYPITEAEPLRIGQTILRRPKEQIYPEGDERNDTAQILKAAERIYGVVDGFYREHSDRIYGSPVRLSARSRQRIRYMAGRGMGVSGIIMGKLLPALNWEMKESVYEKLRDALLNASDENGEPFLSASDAAGFAGKLEAMKTKSGGSVILDYWMSLGR